MELHKDIDFQVLQMGNTNKQNGSVGVITHNVAKTVRKELLNKSKTNACEILDMTNKKMDKSLTNGKQFVQDVITELDYPKKEKTTTEFAVVLWHQDIVQVLQRHQSAVLEIQIDSTGSLVKAPKCHTHNNSRILNHNIVAKLDGVTFPIVEMVGSMANTKSLYHMMKQLKKLLDKVPENKIKFLVMISDWAPQNFNAACHILNQQSLIEYLNCMYTSNKIKEAYPTYLYCCVSHFVHAISKYCSKNLKQQQQHTTSIIIQIFTSIMTADSYDEAFSIIHEALWIFFCKFSTPQLSQRKASLLKLINAPEKREVTRAANEQAEKFHYVYLEFEKEITAEKKTGSLCYQRFLENANKAIEEAEHENNTTVPDTTPNKFYDPQERNGVLYKLLDLKTPYLPLFMYSQYKKLNMTSKRPSNGLIENHHLEIKNGELNNILHRSLCNYVEIRLESLTNKIETTSKPDFWKLVKNGKNRKQQAVKVSSDFLSYFYFFLSLQIKDFSLFKIQKIKQIVVILCNKAIFLSSLSPKVSGRRKFQSLSNL